MTDIQRARDVQCVVCGHATTSHRVDGSCRSRVHARTASCPCTGVEGSATPATRPSLVERLSMRTGPVSDNGCREWLGQKNNKRYGILYHSGGKRAAHRLIYELAHGSLGSQMVDHICGNHGCVNITHLRAVTPGQNGHHRTRMSSRNTSGYPGVFWSNQYQKWQASAGHLGRSRYLGRFDRREDAYLAYVRFALNNFTHAGPAMLRLTPEATALADERMSA